MQNSQTLPPGFVAIEDAIVLIKADRRDKAVVDLQFLVNNLPYLRTKGHYNIRLLKTVEDEKTGGKKVVRNGSVNVFVATDYDKQILQRAIVDAFKERAGIEINVDNPGVNHITSTVDEEKGSMAQVRPNLDASTKAGDAILQRNPQQILQGV